MLGCWGWSGLGAGVGDIEGGSLGMRKILIGLFSTHPSFGAAAADNMVTPSSAGHHHHQHAHVHHGNNMIGTAWKEDGIR